MNKIIKILSINILILIGLLIFVEFSSMLILNIEIATNSLRKVEYGKLAKLPNYEDHDWAKTYFQEYNSLGGADYQSYYGWRRLEFHGETINIDSAGIRRTTGTALDEAKPKVVFLGGSTMWGAGVNDENTIPLLFHRKTDGAYNVINYGETSYTAYQSFIFLQTQIIKGKLRPLPDLIISYDGVNNTSLERIGSFTHFREGQINQLLQRQNLEREEYLSMIYTKKLIGKVKQKYFPTALLIATPTEEQSMQSAIELLDTWLLMKTYLTVLNIDFYCVLQPNAFVGKPSLDNINNFYKSLMRYSAKEGALGYKYYEYVRLLLETERKYFTLKENFIDMTNVLDDIPNLYIDFCHLSPNGNEIVVNNLLKHLNLKK
ncbi:MAG: SGNH/GDSL hydrolase family protein [Ekhidna sp.]|nr:SGNH/GDSL hydrolase family protein [Ekhidna sp.]